MSVVQKSIVALVLVAWTMMGAPGWAQETGCVTTDCHSTMGQAKWVHGPVGVGACHVCHVALEGEDHQFSFPAEREELCFACHEDSRDLMLEENIHVPVGDGDCTDCHDPHQSEYRFTLKSDPSTLCFDCHDKAEFEGHVVHGPVVSGDCTACHDPHASAYPNQLLAAPERICLTCHEEKEEVLARRHQHAPVAEGCTNCHLPHASEAAMLLTDEKPALCWSCHPDLASAATATHQHPPVAEGECGECHDVHGSEYPRLFPMPAEDLCFSCHDELAQYVSEQEFKHGPVEDGDCNACHNPHGSENHMILRKDFPEEFYTSYAESKYDLCFECHNHEIAMEAETKTLTDFRDGKRNLHYLHVNKDVKGRSCRACHQVHASSQEKHIRVSVPYGSISWELPVTYTKTEQGGSCQVGCHAPKEYRR